MKKVDFIVVGQGIAGTMVAHFLAKANTSFVIIDKDRGETASRQATGLINPITGRRFVKSWLIDDLLPFAESTYNEIASVRTTKVCKVLHSVEQINDFDSKKQEKSYAQYMGDTVFSPAQKHIENPLGCISISPVLQVDTAAILDVKRQEFEQKEQLLNEEFDYSELKIIENGVRYKTIDAKKIIFCQGVKGHQNPFFSSLPLRHAKGEVLIFEAKELQIDYVLSSYANIVPLGDNLYSIGATYDWDDVSFSATDKRREELEEKLQKMIKCPYTIIDQKAGIRPTTVDRRPLIGQHSVHKNLYIFNGMGTKGLSLSPYFAQKLVLHLLQGAEIPKEVDIKRFDKK
ncbi:MAG: NAD(P)/FAD-dependent oxidoreductase [Chitinophagales bacterium]